MNNSKEVKLMVLVMVLAFGCAIVGGLLMKIPTTPSNLIGAFFLILGGFFCGCLTRMI